MKIEIYKKKKREIDYLLIKLNGEVDIYTSLNLRRNLVKLIKVRKLIVIDLSNVHYIDSSGVGLLIFILKEVQKIDGVLKLTNLSEKVKKIFSFVNLRGYFNIYESLKEAENSIK